MGRDRRRRRSSPTRRAPSSPTSSSASSTRPRWRFPEHEHDGCAGHRGRPRRGRARCSTRPAAGSPTSSRPRDQVTAAILDRMAADGAGAVWLDLRRSRPGALPDVFATLRAAGLDPAADPVPVAPGRPLPDRRRRTDLDGRTHARRASTPSARPRAPACTGPTGSPRTRSASASCSAPARPRRRSASRARRRPAPPSPRAGASSRPTDETREAVWRAGRARAATRSELERLLDDPYPLARLIAASALARRRVPRRPPAARFPALDPALDGVHVVVDRTASSASNAGLSPPPNGRARCPLDRLNPPLNSIGLASSIEARDTRPRHDFIGAGGYQRTGKDEGYRCTSSAARSIGSSRRSHRGRRGPTGCANKQLVLDACEGDIAAPHDRRYFARPTRTLFTEVRVLPARRAALASTGSIDRNMELATATSNAAARGARPDAVERECQAHTRRGTPCQREPLPGATTAPRTSTSRRTSTWIFELDAEEAIGLPSWTSPAASGGLSDATSLADPV